jgi:hypothetical protein
VRRLLVLIALASGCAGVGLTGGDHDLGTGTGCASQDDCPDGSVCAPSTVGAARGTCSTPSSMHCASCASDSDCDSPTARCLQGPGDAEPACHLDCSLSYLVCPANYNCSTVIDGDAMRQLCLPMSNLCAPANGGACSGATMQACSRTNPSGTCTGHRTCMNGTFGPCDAPEPSPLPHCGDSAPAGCTEQPSAAALSTPTDCGRCGNACPGVTSTTADTACSDPSMGTCGISCRDDNYDLDGNAANGCEAPDSDSANHIQSAPTAFAGTDCNDSDSQNSFSGHLLSDTRAHLNPPVAGFEAAVGAAPHWFSVYSSGGTLCEDDFSVTLTTSGGPDVPCYQATIVTDKITDSVLVTGNGSGTISGTSGSYSDGSTILFEIRKTCSIGSVGDADVAYTVSYHL